jgi:hypothetical protein
MQSNFATFLEKNEKCRHKIVFFIICDVVCNILQLINDSGFAEMHVEKQNIYKKLVTWHYKVEENSEFFFTEYV